MTKTYILHLISETLFSINILYRTPEIIFLCIGFQHLLFQFENTLFFNIHYEYLFLDNQINCKNYDDVDILIKEYTAAAMTSSSHQVRSR